MPKATKLPSGRWRCKAYYYDEKGFRTSKSFTSDRKSEAERLAAEFADSLVKITRDPTVEDAIESYIKYKTPVLSPTTIRGYRKYQKLYFEPLNRLKVSELARDDTLQLWVNHLIAEGVSAKTIRNAYGLLLPSCVKVNRIYKDMFNVTLPLVEIREPTTPDDDMVAELIKNAKMPLKLAICLAAFGTARQGEISAIKYKDVKERTIHIHADIVLDEFNIWQYKPFAKTRKSDRYIELPQKIIDMIPPSDDPEAYIVPLKPTGIRSGFKHLRDKLGFECRFHDLRHYAASFMHSLGIPDAYVMERGGWSSDYTLKRVYRNTLSKDAQKYSDLANSHFLDIGS